jgi:hypothetical protein
MASLPGFLPEYLIVVKSEIRIPANRAAWVPVQTSK